MVDESELDSLKDLVGYTNAQWKTWKRNPNNLKIAENLKGARNCNIIAEVTSSHGCGAGHRVGDRIVYSGPFLLGKENPEKICVYLLSTINQIVGTVFGKIAYGENPTQTIWNKIHCFVVGAENSGWGEVVARKVEKAQE